MSRKLNHISRICLRFFQREAGSSTNLKNQGFFRSASVFSSSYEISFLNEGRAKKTVLKPNSISKPAAAVRTQLNKSSIQSCSTQRRNQTGYFAAEPWLLGHESLPAYNIMLSGHVTTKGMLLLMKLNS